MLRFFDKVGNYWENHGFEILVMTSLIIIILLILYNSFTGKKGTSTKNFIIPLFLKKGNSRYKSLYNEFNKQFNNNQYDVPTTTNIPQESKGEMICRNVVESIFNKKFPKNRPDFLRNPVTGGMHNLELDCYNHELKIAVEYNGKQHYEYSPFFHRNYDHFLNQKYRDDMKRRICKEHGIFLIEVPYTVKHEDIKEFILDKLRHNY